MIGKGKAISHTAASLNYAMVKEKGEVLDKNYLTGDTAREMEREMQTFQELNGRCKNNTFSFVLSPTIEDGKRLSDTEFRALSKDFLTKMGLSEHQSITVKHQDRLHTHLHIYVNRIDMQGKAAPDHHIGKEAQRIADEIAQERKLTRARTRQQEIEQAKKPTKEKIQAIFEDSLKLSKTVKEFFLNIKEKGVMIKKSMNKQGQVQGYRASMDGESFKASEIGNKYTLKKIDKTIEKSVLQQEAENKQQIRQNRHSRGFGL